MNIRHFVKFKILGKWYTKSFKDINAANIFNDALTSNGFHYRNIENVKRGITNGIKK